MLIAYSDIKLSQGVGLADLALMAINRGTFITDSGSMLKEQHLYAVENEVGLWTFDELKRHFLN